MQFWAGREERELITISTLIVLGNKRKINTNSHLTGELEIIYFCMADAQKDTSAARERLPLIGFVAVFFYFCLFLSLVISRDHAWILELRAVSILPSTKLMTLLGCWWRNVEQITLGSRSKSAAEPFRYTSLHTRPRSVVLSWLVDWH